MHRILLSFLFVLSMVCSLSGQHVIDYSLLQEDLKILSDIATGTSPKLSTKEREEIDSLTRVGAAKLEGNSMNVIDFINFYSSIGFNTQFDEHAILELEEDVLAPVFAETKVFPLPVIFVGSLLVVNIENDSIPYGSVIYEINGVSVDSVIQLLSADNDSFSKRMLERQFAIIYAIKNLSTYTYSITYSLPSAPDTRQVKLLEGILVDEWVRKMNESAVYPLHRESLAKLIHTAYFPDHKAFYFQFNSFSWDQDLGKSIFNTFRSDRKKFEKEFDQLFQRVKESGAESLIIDLRHNGGGNLYIPGLLYAYIAKEPFTQDVQLQIPDFTFPHLNYITEIAGESVQSEKRVMRILKKYQDQFEKKDSLYTWNFMEYEKQLPKDNAFEGKVYLLVGGRSISASSYFTAIFKSEKRGLIIGEELGGSHHSITAGVKIKYKLPNTKITATVPIMIVTFSDELYREVPELKIVPDWKTTESEHYASFLKQRDVELYKVFEIIQSNK